MKQEAAIKKRGFYLTEFLKKHKQNIFPLLALVIVIVLFQIASGGKLLTQRNMRTLVNTGFFTIVSAIGLTFVIAQGALDFSLGANLGVSCAIAATMAKISPLLALPSAVLSGLLIGLTNGTVYARLRVDSFITTVSVKMILSGLVVIILADGHIGIPLEMLHWDSAAMKMASMIVIALIGFVVFQYTRIGKHIRAVSSERAAFQAGVNVANIKILGFAISGAVVGLLAFFNILYTGSASSLTGAGFELDALIALLLGGMQLTGGADCKFRSAIIGGLTVTFLTNGMTMCGLSGEIQQITRGIIFLLAVTLTFDRKNIAVIK